MIDARIANFGIVVNGWLANAQTGSYGNDYLFRATNTQYGIGTISDRKLSIQSHSQTLKENHSIVTTDIKFTFNLDKLHP